MKIAAPVGAVQRGGGPAGVCGGGWAVRGRARACRWRSSRVSVESKRNCSSTMLSCDGGTRLETREMPRWPPSARVFLCLCVSVRECATRLELLDRLLCADCTQLVLADAPATAAR